MVTKYVLVPVRVVMHEDGTVQRVDAPKPEDVDRCLELGLVADTHANALAYCRDISQ